VDNQIAEIATSSSSAQRLAMILVGRAFSTAPNFTLLHYDKSTSVRR